MNDCGGKNGERYRTCEVILIAGFLGSGKTTLLRNILSWPGNLSETAVLVNEFGEIGIDGELFNGLDTPVVQLTNGCICCSIKGDLIKTVRAILDGFDPSRLFIEATGVGDPFEILNILEKFEWEGRTERPKTVTVLAGDMWLGREIFGPLFYNQIKAAELLLFNKIDLVPDGDIPCFLEGIREINPSCSIVPTYRCQIDPNVLWQSLVPTEREKEVHFHHFPSDSADAEGIGFVTFSFENESPFESDCFRHFIATLPVEVFRVKGFAVLEDKRVLVNHVGGKTEWADVNETGPTKLTFIGWQVDAEQILGRLKKCL